VVTERRQAFNLLKKFTFIKHVTILPGYYRRLLFKFQHIVNIRASNAQLLGGKYLIGTEKNLATVAAIRESQANQPRLAVCHHNAKQTSQASEPL